MPDPLLPLRFVLLVFAGLVNREQARAIEFLREENRVLREQLGRRIRLVDGQRRRLAAKGAALGRKALQSLATIVTPDTILRWHRELVAAKFTHAAKKPRVGRPGLMKTIREQVVRMAKENTRWGYARIRGEMKKLGHKVAASTIADALKRAGIPPSPERPTSWRTFLKVHAGTIAAMDFFTTEGWTARGLVTHHVLFVIHHNRLSRGYVRSVQHIAPGLQAPRRWSPPGFWRTGRAVRTLFVTEYVTKRVLTGVLLPGTGDPRAAAQLLHGQRLLAETSLRCSGL